MRADVTHVVAAELAHFHALDVQPWQKTHAYLLQDDAQLTGLLAGGPAISVLDGDRVLCVGGAFDKGGGRAECWAWFSADIGGKMLFIHRAALGFLDAAPFRRLEMYVHEKHWQGIRWACALHFRVERSADSTLAVRLESWFEDGSAALPFSRVRQAAVPATALQHAEASQLSH
jgi:hypothetical protein